MLYTIHDNKFESKYFIISPSPLKTELPPGARATLMSFNVAALSLGRALGAPLAPLLYGFGFLAVAAGAVGFNMLALVALRKMQKQSDC